ncbi:putative dehydrogenase [Pseudonocardia sediminis]|uniref:Putative dehydrogenase n=1 Tax=Pseudonocardia sediminis TaxID=1397368 RepID=A0A4Q7V376_PSEST|nr:Gfo/Idh/MocA family oxidoreductase [Pseudonocardia sediminis]RZT87881.1 putative dehydrogenase [Pseudonocardia sediminis]
MAYQRPIAVAVVGYGYWGSKHARVLSSIPDTEVVVVDGNEARLAEAEATHHAVAVSRSLENVIDRVDAVVICTPPGSHAAIGMTALAAGKHTLVEKPLATSVVDAEGMVTAADREGVQLMVGHTFEFNPAVWKLREVVRSGALGRILYVDTARLSLGRYQSDVNVIWDLAPHDISIASYLLDDMPSRATVWAERNIGFRHADVAYLKLEFDRADTHAFVRVSWLSPNKVRKVTVVGERQMAVYDDLSDNERIRIYDIGVDPADHDESVETHAMPVSYRTGDITSPYVAFSEPLLLQDRHFLDCIRTGATSASPGSRGADVVRVLAATDRAIESGLTASIVPAPVVELAGVGAITELPAQRVAS